MSNRGEKAADADLALKMITPKQVQEAIKVNRCGFCLSPFQEVLATVSRIALPLAPFGASFCVGVCVRSRVFPSLFESHPDGIL